MTVKWDDMGNIYARQDGVQNDKPPVVIGPHLDSVKKGGRFDGTLGVIAGLEVVRTIKKNGIKPRVPIVLVNFTNEEGARFEPSIMSSRVLSGKFKKSEVIQSTGQQGISFKEALEFGGFEGSDENRLKEAKAFLEFHQPFLQSRKSRTLTNGNSIFYNHEFDKTRNAILRGKPCRR